MSNATNVALSVAPAPPPQYEMRLLTMADVPALLSLRNCVVADLPKSDDFGPWQDEFAVDHIEDKGCTFGLFTGAALAAYAAIGLPRPGDENLGEALGLPQQSLSYVANIASCMVLPAHRKKGLHGLLTQARINYGLNFGKRHFVAAIAPRNRGSWSSIARFGLHVKCLRTMYGTRTRYLVHWRAGECVSFNPATAVTCDVTDYDRQIDLLADGYWGWKKPDCGTRNLIVYGKPVPH